MNSPERTRSLLCISYFVLLIFIVSSCTSNKLSERELMLSSSCSFDQPFSNSVFISVEGVRLHIRQWNNSSQSADKGLVFLIPGATGSTENWRFLVPVFCSYGWNVVCVDFPPFGFSGEKQTDSNKLDPLPEDTYSRSSLMWQVFDSLYPSYEGNLILGGHSHGGRIAAAMAIERPFRVSQLLLFAPALYGVSTIPGIYKYEPWRSFAKRESRRLLEQFFAVNYVMKTVYGRPVTDEEFNRNWTPFTREGAKDASVEWLTSSVDPYPLPLEKLTVPVLMFWSKYDKIVPNKGKVLAKTLKNAEYIPIKGSSHCIIETDTSSIILRLIPLLKSY